MPLQRFWTAAFSLTRTNSCATLTPSTGATSSKTLWRNSWWCRPTAVTLDVSISTYPPSQYISHSPRVGLELLCWLRLATFRCIILQVTLRFFHADITLALACDDINDLDNLLVWVVYTPDIPGKDSYRHSAGSCSHSCVFFNANLMYSCS